MSTSLMHLNIDKLSNEEVDVLQTKIIARKMKRFEAQIAEMANAQKMLETGLKEITLEQERIKEDSEKKLEVAVNSMRVKQPKYGYVNQGDFGRFFTVSIGSRTMGKLLKVVGLAMKNKNQTTPYREHIPKCAMTEANENYTAVRWNYEKCLDYIDGWLKENDYFESFYSISSPRDMEKFINQLYERYC